MTDYFKYTLKVVSKFLKKDILFRDFVKAVCLAIEDLDKAATVTKNNFYFDKMTLNAVIFMEKLLKIIPKATQTLDNRRDVIRARWRGYGHNSIKLIQMVCEAWKNGEVEADFVNGKIQLKFIGEYGIPEDLQALIDAINVIKPSHLAYYLIYKYLLIEDIHEVMPIEELETHTIDHFAF